MRVIKKGSDNEEFGKDLVCRGDGVGRGRGGCGSILRVMPRDVESDSCSDYGGGSDTYYWFVCPECRVKTYVDPKVFK